MAKIERRLYKSVPANSMIKNDFVPGAKQKLYLEELGGNAAFEKNTFCKIVWDAAGVNKILFVTYGSDIQKTSEKIIGDGVKKLTIELHNKTAAPVILGAFYTGDIHDFKSANFP